MKYFKAKTYVPYNFPILETNQELDVWLKEENDWIGKVKVLGIEDDQYLLDFSLNKEVSGDLYATVSQTSSDTGLSYPHISLSKDQIYERFIQTIGSQQF